MLLCAQVLMLIMLTPKNKIIKIKIINIILIIKINITKIMINITHLQSTD